MSSFLSLFRINTSFAPDELSYSTTPVLPPGATPEQLDGAGRGRRLSQHWHQDCWPQDSPGLSQISATVATQDSPCACTWASQCLPLLWHCPPGRGAAGTAAMQCTGCNTCSLSCAACMNRFELHCSQLGLGDPCSSLCSLPGHAGPPHVL